MAMLEGLVSEASEGSQLLEYRTASDGRHCWQSHSCNTNGSLWFLRWLDWFSLVFAIFKAPSYRFLRAVARILGMGIGCCIYM